MRLAVATSSSPLLCMRYGCGAGQQKDIGRFVKRLNDLLMLLIFIWGVRIWCIDAKQKS